MCSQAGLPARLRTIVDLEALLNDGSAYVLFFLLRVSLSSLPGGHPFQNLLSAHRLVQVADWFLCGQFACLAGNKCVSCVVVSVPEVAWGC